MSAEIERYQPRQELTTIDLAPKAWKLAKAIAHTDFVPKGLRGKEEAVLAAILTGHELGIEPMQALAKIYVIEGRPTISAEMMRAIVERAGHEVYPTELTNTRVTVCGKRKGSDRPPVEVTWTIDDAKRAKLDQKDVWRKYPRAMLYARATSEICRMLFPDVLAGVSYTKEELEDGVIPDDETPTAVGLVGYEPKPAPAEPEPTEQRTSSHVATDEPAETEQVEERPPAPRGAVPPLPGEDDDDIADAEVVERDEAPPPPEEEDWHDPAPEHDPGPRMSGPQMIAMRLGERGIRAQADRRAWVAEFVGHPVESTKDLSSDEVAQVLAYLDGLDEGVRLMPPRPAPDPEPEESPATWDGEQWRAHFKATGVTVVKALKHAVTIGAETGEKIGALDDLAGTRAAEQLAAWCREQGS